MLDQFLSINLEILQSNRFEQGDSEFEELGQIENSSQLHQIHNS